MDEDTLRKFAASLDLETNMSRDDLCVQVADAIDRRVNQAQRATQLQLPAKFLSLPADIVRRILTQVDVNTLLMACQTNEQVRAICNDPRLWKLMWDARFPKKTEIMRTSNDADLLRKEYLSYARTKAAVKDFHRYSYGTSQVELPIPYHFADFLKRKENFSEGNVKFYYMMRDDVRAALAVDNYLLDNVIAALKRDNDDGSEVGDEFEAAFNDTFVRENVLQVGENDWSMPFAPLLQVAVLDEINPKRLSTDTLCNLDLLQNSIFVEDALALPQRLLSGDIIVGDNLTYWYVQHDKDGTRYVPFSQNTLPEVAWERVKEMGTPADFWNIPLQRTTEDDPGSGTSTYPHGGFTHVIAPPDRNLERYPDKRNQQTRTFYEPLVSEFNRKVVMIVDDMESLVAPRNLSFPAHELAKKVASIVASVSFPFDGCIPLLRPSIRSQVELAVKSALETFPLTTPEVMASLVFQKPVRDERQWVMDTAYRVGTDEEYDTATAELAQYLRDTWYNDEWWDQGWKMDPWWAFLNAIKEGTKGPGEVSRGSAINMHENALFKLRRAFDSRTTTQRPTSDRNIRQAIEKFASMYSLHTQDSDDKDEESQAFFASDKWKNEDLPHIMSFVPANAYWISSLGSLLAKLNLPPETTVGELSRLLEVEAANVPVRRADAALVEEMEPLKTAVLSDAKQLLPETTQHVLDAVRRPSGARQLVALNAILGFAFPHIVYPCSLFYADRMVNNITTDVPDFEELFLTSANNKDAYRKRLARYQESGRSTDSVKQSIADTQRQYEETMRLLGAMDNFTPLLYNIWSTNAKVDDKPPTFTVFEKQLANAVLQSPMSEAAKRELVLRETYPALMDGLARQAHAIFNTQRPWISLAVQEADERSDTLNMLRKMTGLRLAPTKDEVERQLEINRRYAEDREDGVISKYVNVIGEDDIEDATLEQMLEAYNTDRPQEAVEIWNRALAELDRPRQRRGNLEEEELAAALGGREQVERARREEEQVLGVARPIVDEQ